MLRRSTTNRSRRPPGAGFQLSNAFFGWTLAFIVLIGVAVVSWVGSFYIFGHPENPFSYKILKRLDKLEDPKRFELSSAPRGDFLDADALMERFGTMTPGELRDANAELLRNFIRNYEQVKDRVPYIIGKFNIMDSYELGGATIFPAGIVALARSTENPRVLLELVYTSDEETMPTIHRSLLTGVDVKIERRRELAAILHVASLPDGRLKFTAIPLLYDTYASDFGPGTFSLEPPPTLDLETGLPVVLESKVEEADQKYAAYRRRAGLPQTAVSGAASDVEQTRQLLRVERPRPVSGEAPEIPEEPSAAESTAATEEPPPRIMRPLPVDGSGAPAALPLDGIAAVPALPLETSEAAEAVATPEVSPEPEAEPTVPLEPFPAATPTPRVTASGGSWPTYPPGRMPRGRLVGVDDVNELAARGLGGTPVYLQGSFVTTASGETSAVLRSTGRHSGTVRVIVSFPSGMTPPGRDESVSRGESRPFLVNRIERMDDGTINVRVQEVTRP